MLLFLGCEGWADANDTVCLFYTWLHRDHYLLRELGLWSR